ncbi:hypothetical protein [Gimesia maris]|uniref:hypothetical protein n=1 Tax=Gimesia maris TaxID=122 RepID=UPI00241E839B|nr:hypothetical protein [Gimesia maris]|tara:strand:- start:1723 stop:2280 length:558 start_codon:yes stop_codon:yes gene_type:complete
MSKWTIVLIFVACAALSWGTYVPLVHIAAQKLHSNLRAFLFVGVAYFLVAVLIPAFFIFVLGKDPTVKGVPNFDAGPIAWGILAGTAGAIGALCVIFAVTTGGKGAAIYVAPLVFAGAPIVNTIATITVFHPTKTLPDIRFFLGLGLAAAGAAMVMIYKPVDKPHAVPAAVEQLVEPAANDAGTT